MTSQQPWPGLRLPEERRAAPREDQRRARGAKTASTPEAPSSAVYKM